MVTQILRFVKCKIDEGTFGTRGIYDIRCLSTDTKPAATNGSTLVEIDTGNKYIYNGDSNSWSQINNSTIMISADGVLF